MQIKTIDLNDGKPVRVTADLTVTEAAQIARWTGGLSPATGGTEETGEIYECLTGELFNRFWDSGVDGYTQGDQD